MTEATPRPIFVVGCQRSGTTMLRLMLDSHPRIACGPETRFLEDLERVTGSDWKRLQQFGFPREEWLARMRAFFGGIQDDYAASKGKARWADKSPRYALHMPFLHEVFPDAQFVHVIRDGRDVAVSHRKRFGYWSSVKSSVKWPRYIKAARTAGAAMPADSYHELRYDDLVGDPERTLRDLLAFLGEDWDDGVLDFVGKKHDVPDRYHRQHAARTASAGTDGAVYASRVGTYRTELDPLVRALFFVTSRRTLKDLGY
ncbi:sulfotransferase family protein [Lapillicoccus jejuensis]|uniref:Sulfotransferase family protein n=1 Tax=Lapillicoccus jejuensis TaxID=402171 RepID=A0A542E1G9_9MICO|nr:sulfotransferase [Lapillicoccus jejuensis]TQJ09190.1 sulfotransferase family protein [Lapillicoccus jejuensis]